MTQNKDYDSKNNQQGAPLSPDEARRALVLYLLYLSGWEEDSRRNPGEKIFRAWKGFLFEDLRHLQDNDLILQFPKSTVVTDKGLQLARGMQNHFNQMLNVQA